MEDKEIVAALRAENQALRGLVIAAAGIITSNRWDNVLRAESKMKSWAATAETVLKEFKSK